MGCCAAQEGPMWFRDQATTWQGFSWQDFSQRESRRDSGQRSWQNFRTGFAARTRRFAADESGLRRRIWQKLKREAANIPFVEDALTAHYCAFDRNTPLYVKLALVGAVVYFIVPDDLIPDSIPVLGYADDAAVLAGAMKLFSTHIKPEHREAAKVTLERMRRA
jgi:uncharacterized membrane protein YkvA (DUF1232 family)